LFVQHLAWLHAVPDTKDSRASRIDSLPENHIYRTMPDAGGADHLLSHLMQVGICSSGANGAIPLSWSELKSYIELSGSELDSWECETVIELSRAYVSTLSAARQPEMPPPFVTDDEEALAIHKKEQVQLMKQAVRASVKS
jgi:hypothetical protein